MEIRNENENDWDCDCAAEMTEAERREDRRFLDVCTARTLTEEEYTRFLGYREELVLRLIDAMPPGEHPLVVESACLTIAATASAGGLARSQEAFLHLARVIHAGVSTDMLNMGKERN